MNQLGEQFVRLLALITKAVARFLRGYAFRLLVLVVILLVIWNGWTWFREYSTSEISFLMGKRNSPSESDAQLIEDEIGNENAYSGRTILELVSTRGYEDNRQLVDADATGKVAGFAYDGFEESKNVTTVLPLDKRYLHILCRKDFVERVLAESEEDRTPGGTLAGRLPETWRNAIGTFGSLAAPFLPAGPADTAGRTEPLWQGRVSLRELYSRMGSNVYSKLRPGRVFLGVEGSVTRQTAETVLKHFNLDPGKLQCNGVANGREMRAALNNGSIDMAFSSGPFNATTIRDIARDGNCVLVGLDGDRDAIIQNHPGLLPVEFEANCYVSGKFCPDKLQTVGARRVLICSRSMSEQDAYLLGTMAAEALRYKIPEIEWQNLPPGARELLGTPLRYQLHPGAELIRKNQEPSRWPQGTSVILVVLGVSLLTELIRWLNSLFKAGEETPESDEKEKPEKPVSQKEPEDQYQALKKDLDERIAELERAPGRLTKRSYESWDRRIAELRERVLSGNREGALTREQTHTLLEGLRRDLLYEHEIRKPKPRKKAGAN